MSVDRHDSFEHNSPHNEGGNILSSLLPIEDLTREARSGSILPTVTDATVARDLFDKMARALYRKQHGHILITGYRGVGKTATVRELARRAALGEISFLRDKQFVRIDCQDVAPEDSRACLEAIFSSLSSHPNLILCLDGLAALWRRPMGGSNKPLLRAALNRPQLRVIGILSKWDYNDLIGCDADISDFFTRIEIEEPREEHSLEILRQSARAMSTEFRLGISDSTVQRTVALSSICMLSDCHPAKAIRLLRQACENADYERTQLGMDRSELGVSDVIHILSQTSGIPEQTLEGDTGFVDFEAALAEAVVGQERAIQAVAVELRLIKAGLGESGKPATVMLFAGMTGVGKTELAKRIAELYSTSKRLQTYTMGNFTEPHSVSGIIGVPPGYVGHELGGRLVNDLISDPYSVFLLDEAEKAHPNVWKPFLNLFDEGWVVDQRGVKAYADRAIFILTTNSGSDFIAQMSSSGKSQQEIEERVKNTLSKVRQERTSQPVFPPAFLARLKRIVVFEALSESAMIAIARKIVRQVQQTWQQKRGRMLSVSEEAIELIGRRAHSLNEKSGGQEGGRIVRRLISDLIEDGVQRAASSRPHEYKQSKCIDVTLLDTCSEGADPILSPAVQFIS